MITLQILSQIPTLAVHRFFASPPPTTEHGLCPSPTPTPWPVLPLALPRNLVLIPAAIFPLFDTHGDGHLDTESVERAVDAVVLASTKAVERCYLAAARPALDKKAAAVMPATMKYVLWDVLEVPVKRRCAFAWADDRKQVQQYAGIIFFGAVETVRGAAHAAKRGGDVRLSRECCWNGQQQKAPRLFTGEIFRRSANGEPASCASQSPPVNSLPLFVACFIPPLCFMTLFGPSSLSLVFSVATTAVTAIVAAVQRFSFPSSRHVRTPTGDRAYAGRSGRVEN